MPEQASSPGFPSPIKISSAKGENVMRCTKCGLENPDTNQFCSRCHNPTRFTCPACKNVQHRGGQCEQCGLDFVKHATMLVFQGQTTAQQRRQRKKERGEILRQILLLPITGGWSLLKYLKPPKDTG
jgi:zinc-ribbon domain